MQVDTHMLQSNYYIIILESSNVRRQLTLTTQVVP